MWTISFSRGRHNSRGETEATLRTFRAGTSGRLNPDHAIALIGLRFAATRDRSVLLSQPHYIAEGGGANVKDYIKDRGENSDVKKYRTSVKKASGSLIWIHRARPYIGYNIDKIETEAAPPCSTDDISF